MVIHGNQKNKSLKIFCAMVTYGNLKSEHERAALTIFIEERELSAARDFHWRAQVERRSNFELKNIKLEQN